MKCAWLSIGPGSRPLLEVDHLGARPLVLEHVAFLLREDACPFDSHPLSELKRSSTVATLPFRKCVGALAARALVTANAAMRVAAGTRFSYRFSLAPHDNSARGANRAPCNFFAG